MLSNHVPTLNSLSFFIYFLLSLNPSIWILRESLVYWVEDRFGIALGWETVFWSLQTSGLSSLWSWTVFFSSWSRFRKPQQNPLIRDFESVQEVLICFSSNFTKHLSYHCACCYEILRSFCATLVAWHCHSIAPHCQPSERHCAHSILKFWFWSSVVTWRGSLLAVWCSQSTSDWFSLVWGSTHMCSLKQRNYCGTHSPPLVALSVLQFIPFPSNFISL
jgi:hypothetical protein